MVPYVFFLALLILLEVIAVVAPSDCPLQEAPVGRTLTESLAEEVHRYSRQQHDTLNSGHLPVSGEITFVCDPCVGVETQDEADYSFEGECGCNDFIANWLVAVDCVYKGDIGSGANVEVDQT